MRQLRAEWTKFRTVRGWVIGIVVAALVMVVFGLLIAIGGSTTCDANPASAAGQSGAACLPYFPLGPGGEAVCDNFYFVRQPLDGNGSITVRVTSLTGLYSPHGGIAAGLGVCGDDGHRGPRGADASLPGRGPGRYRGT